MENPFYNDIYEILRLRGRKGLPVGLIAKQVYNRHASLFNTELTYEKVYQNIRFFLWSQSNRPSSPFIQGESRGWYALKPNIYEQMELEFTDDTNEDPTENKESIKSEPIDYPSLF